MTCWELIGLNFKISGQTQQLKPKGILNMLNQCKLHDFEYHNPVLGLASHYSCSPIFRPTLRLHPGKISSYEMYHLVIYKLKMNKLKK